MKRRLWALVAVVVPTSVLAAPPERKGDPEQYSRSGSQVIAMREVITTTTRPIHWDHNIATPAGRPACFQFGTMAVVHALAEATCCWTLTTTITIGAQTTEAATTLVDDNGPDGHGACVTLAAGERTTMIPDAKVMMTSTHPGYRAGICSGPQANVYDISNSGPNRVTPFCRVDGDCTDADVTSGTCSTAGTTANYNTKRGDGCAFMVCIGAAASTDVTVTIER